MEETFAPGAKVIAGGSAILSVGVFVVPPRARPRPPPGRAERCRQRHSIPSVLVAYAVDMRSSSG